MSLAVKYVIFSVWSLWAAVKVDQLFLWSMATTGKAVCKLL